MNVGFVLCFDVFDFSLGQRGCVRNTILEFDHLKPGEISHPSVKTGVRIVPVFDMSAYRAAKPFHRKCPITPHGPSGFNPVCDVEKCVD